MDHRVKPGGDEPNISASSDISPAPRRRPRRGAIDRVAGGIVFRMPLHAERKAWRFGDPDRLYRFIFG
jgi:hypothetical protein